MSKNNEYRPGNPEYDYWNDKNLYPSLRHNEDYPPLRQSADFGEPKVGLDSVFFTVFVWILIFAPFAVFLRWESWVTQIVFWGGLAITMVVFILWICSVIEDNNN